MDIDREVKVRDAIKYCIENFDSKTATNRIVEFLKDELKRQEQTINYSQCCMELKDKEETAFDLWLKNFKEEDNCYWFNKETLYCKEAMKYIYNTEIKPKL